MLIAFPFLTLILIFLNLYSFRQALKLNHREKILTALIFWFLLFAIITEILSPFRLITLSGISISWAVVLFILFARIFWKKPILSNLIPKMDKPLDSLSKILLLVIGVILGTTFILALFVAPNDIDAMVYHLARIPHWIQNQSISYYATHWEPQIYLAPFASYAQLHLFILSGGDRFANLIQWICMVGSLLGISLITKHFGGNLKSQIFSSFIAATIPMGIMQASSSQDDYIVSFFLISFVYFALHFKSWEDSKLLLFLSGVSLGLSFLTKQTAYIYALPFIYWFLWRWTSAYGLKKAFSYMLVIGILAITVNIGFYARNILFVGLPIFSLRDDYINNPVGISSLISGLIKYIALNLSTPFSFLNMKVYEYVVNVHNILRIPINYEGFSWPYKFGVPPYIAIEYYASNSSHLVLLLLSIYYMVTKLKTYKLQIIYACIALLGFMFFSSIIRWQPSFSRLHLPVFLLLSTVIGLALIKKAIWIKTLIIIILIINSFYFLFFNHNKPLLSKHNVFLMQRDEQYFLTLGNENLMYNLYRNIATEIKEKKYDKVGLIYDSNSYNYEYPLWVELTNVNKNITIEHIDVQNATIRFEKKNFRPEIVVFLSGNKNLLEKYINKGIPVIGLNYK